MNDLVRRRINTQKNYRRKVTLTIVLSAILMVLILIGLIKVIVDAKKEEIVSEENSNRVSAQLTPGASEHFAENITSENGEEIKPEENHPESLPEPTATPTPTPTPVPKKKVAAAR